MAFHLFADARDINLDERFACGELLSLAEVEELARVCRWPLTELAALSLPGDDASNVLSLEKVRMGGQKSSTAEVDPDVAASRLRYIRMYLQWLSTGHLNRHGLEQSVWSRLSDTTRFLVEAIDARIPHGKGRNVLSQREGISDEAVMELLRVSDPLSPDNPWRDLHTRYRNALFIRWLLYLGLRIGETLGVC